MMTTSIVALIVCVWCENDQEWKQRVNEKVFSPRHPPVRPSFHSMLTCTCWRVKERQCVHQEPKPDCDKRGKITLITTATAWREIEDDESSPLLFLLNSSPSFFGFLSSHLSPWWEKKQQTSITTST